MTELIDGFLEFVGSVTLGFSAGYAAAWLFDHLNRKKK